jgi:hypothetical protein
MLSAAWQTCSRLARRATIVPDVQPVCPGVPKLIRHAGCVKRIATVWQTCNSLTRCSGCFPDMQPRGSHAKAWQTCRQQGRFTKHGSRADSPADLHQNAMVYMHSPWQICSQNVIHVASMADVQLEWQTCNRMAEEQQNCRHSATIVENMQAAWHVLVKSFAECRQLEISAPSLKDLQPALSICSNCG